MRGFVAGWVACALLLGAAHVAFADAGQRSMRDLVRVIERVEDILNDKCG